MSRRQRMGLSLVHSTRDSGRNTGTSGCPSVALFPDDALPFSACRRISWICRSTAVLLVVARVGPW